MLYEALRAVLVPCLDLFYSRTSLGGQIPPSGPVLLVANHPNGMIDPVLLGCITRRRVRFLAKAAIFRMPVLGPIVRALGCLPVYRQQDSPGEQDKNEQTFTACFEALAQGDAVAIFPEGISHSQPALQKLKTGAARIVLGAERRSGFTLGVRVVPVGLTYRNKHLFRGQVATQVGEPIAAAEFRELHARDPQQAAQQLTQRIGQELSRLTINVDRWEDLPALEAAEQIYASEKRLDTAPAEREQRLRRFAEGLRVLRQHHPERVERLRDPITAFTRRLRDLGADPQDLDTNYTPTVVTRFVARNLAALLLGLPLAAFGIVFFFIPYQMPRLFVTLWKQDLDLLASVKLGVALLVFPLWYLAAVLITAVAAGGWAALALAVGAPVAGWYAIRFQERRGEALEDLAVFLRLGLGRARKQRLLARRAVLAAQIDALAAQLESLQQQPPA